jgi:hypothetical protein
MPTTYELNMSPETGATFLVGTLPTPIGTVSNGGAGSGLITGAGGTEFLDQFSIGDSITVGGETKTVLQVSSDSSMLTTPFTASFSGASYAFASPAPLRFRITDGGLIEGSQTSLTSFNMSPQLTLDNGSTDLQLAATARFQPRVTYTGSGSSFLHGVYANLPVARTTNDAKEVLGSAVFGSYNVAGSNRKNWGHHSDAMPGGVHGRTLALPGAEGTIAHLAAVVAEANTSSATVADIGKLFGFAMMGVKCAANQLTNGVGAGIYKVEGDNRAYVVLAPDLLDVPTGNWAIWDDTGYDTRLSGAVKVGAGSDLVIDSDAILHQYGVALPKNNNMATAEPTASDDSTADYSVGSLWFWPATGRSWRLADATASAAVWVETALAEQPAYVSNHWYLGPDMSVAAGTPPTADAMQFAPLLIKARVTLSTLGVRITTSETGGNLQLALYANDPAAGRPTGDAVATTAGISTSSTGVVSATIAGGSVTLEPGMYWASFNLDSTAGGNVAVQVPAPDNHPTASLVGSASQANLGSSGADNLVSLYVSQSYGTWPDVTSATFVEGSTASRNGPAIHFKVA